MSEEKHLNLKYKNKLKKLNWRNDLSIEDLKFLIQSLFNINYPEEITGLIDKENRVIDLKELVNKIQKYKKQIVIIQTNKTSNTVTKLS